MQQDNNIDCLAIRKLDGIDSQAHGTTYLFPIKEEFFYRRYDESRDLMGLYTFETGDMTTKSVKQGYTGAYLYDK
jgi:hypothetical protein